MSETELKVMEKIWENQKGVGVDSDVIYAYFKEHTDYAIGTISTLIHRIINKGYLESIRKGKHKLFIPLTNREDYYKAVEENELCETVKKFEDIMATYTKKTKLSAENGEKLKLILREIRNE